METTTSLRPNAAVLKSPLRLRKRKIVIPVEELGKLTIETCTVGLITRAETGVAIYPDLADKANVDISAPAMLRIRALAFSAGTDNDDYSVSDKLQDVNDDNRPFNKKKLRELRDLASVAYKLVFTKKGVPIEL